MFTISTKCQISIAVKYTSLIMGCFYQFAKHLYVSLIITDGCPLVKFTKYAKHLNK